MQSDNHPTAPLYAVLFHTLNTAMQVGIQQLTSSLSSDLSHSYDIGSARLKYLEGFWVNPRTKEIQSKPAQQWNVQDTLHVEPLYYTLACCLAFENCVFFLLQAFWSYISKSVTKSSFMSSFEFKVNITASCFVLVLFPTAQFLFRNDFLYREAVPQVIFSALMFITGILGLRTHFRLVALIKNARAIMNETTINVVHKLEYFRDMVCVQTMAPLGCFCFRVRCTSTMFTILESSLA